MRPFASGQAWQRAEYLISLRILFPEMKSDYMKWEKMVKVLSHEGFVIPLIPISWSHLD